MQMHFSILAYDDVKCSKCHQFRKWNEGKGWHYYQCPECVREYQRQYYTANADARREYYRQWSAANADAKREHNRQYHAEHPEVARKASRNRRARKHNAVCVHGSGCFDRAAKQMPQRCVYCGTDQDITADHYHPLADGGLDCKDNLQPVCHSCNSRKGATDPIDFRRRLGMLL